MRNINFSSWTGKIVWAAGLVLLILGRNYIEEQFLWQLRIANDNLFLYNGIVFLLPFLTGIYLSLLFLWSNFKVNDASLLFIVAIPSFILSVLPMVIQQVSIPLPHTIIWLVSTLNIGEILPLVAGLAILPSFSLGRKTTGRR